MNNEGRKDVKEDYGSSYRLFCIRDSLVVAASPTIKYLPRPYLKFQEAHNNWNSCETRSIFPFLRTYLGRLHIHPPSLLVITSSGNLSTTRWNHADSIKRKKKKKQGSKDEFSLESNPSRVALFDVYREFFELTNSFRKLVRTLTRGAVAFWSSLDRDKPVSRIINTPLDIAKLLSPETEENFERGFGIIYAAAN